MIIKSLPLLIVIILGCRNRESTDLAEIRIDSMTCDECAGIIKEAIFELEGVKDVDININSKKIKVKYISRQTNVESIEIAITRAGFDANDRKRDSDAFDELPDCCKRYD